MTSPKDAKGAQFDWQDASESKSTFQQTTEIELLKLSTRLADLERRVREETE